jgi:ABC-type Mn2+/Zn2+ transport system permease subunit
MMLIATIVGAASTYLGLLLSYWLDVAAGATIVLVAVSVFFVVLALSQARDAGRHVSTTDTAGETLA